MGKPRRGKSLARAGAVSTIILLLSAYGWAMQYPQDPAEAAAGYLSARQQFHIMGELAPGALTSPTVLLGGAVVELVGEIVGHTSVCKGTETTYCLLLAMVNGLTVSLDYPEPIEGLRAGQTVQVLATVPKNSADGRHFELNYIVRQCDLPAELRQPATVPNPSEEQGASSAAPDTAPAGGPSLSPSPPPVQQGLLDWGTRRVPSAPGTQGEVDPQQQRIEIWQAWVQQHNSKLMDTECEKIVRWVLDWSAVYRVDHRLIFAVIEAESYFDPECISHAGALGLMQLMPGTAKYVHVEDRWNVRENIRGGIQYLAEQLARYTDKSNYEQCVLGLACYNAGPNAVDRYGGVPPYKETRNYVIKVTKKFAELVEAGYP